MIDPVMRDLDRHLARIDRSNAIEEHAEWLQEDNPEKYGEMDEGDLLEAAEADLAAEAEAAQIAQYEDMQRGY